MAKKNFTLSLHAEYGESDSLQKNLDVFVPTFSKCSPGKPCVWEMYLICYTREQREKCEEK